MALFFCLRQSAPIRLILAALLLLGVASPGGADPSVPEIAASASAYQKTIEALPREMAAPQVLRAIKQAESAGATAELIRLYERLVALNATNFRAWFQLGITWREADGGAEKGLDAAYLAFGVTRSAPEQVEALLLMSSFLRARLDGLRAEYEAARTDVQKNERMLAYLRDVGGVDPQSPTGNLTAATQARDAAAQRSALAAGQIARVASELDEVYRDIAARVPGTDAGKMQEGDSRSAVFAPVLQVRTPGGKDETPNESLQTPPDAPRLTFRTVGNDVQVCLDFTQDLHANDLSYRNFLEIKPQGNQTESTPVTTFGVVAKDRTLCITGLAAGKSYSLLLRAGLPSKEGAKLATPISIPNVTLPDLPKQIAFSGRNFILPASGPGQVPLFATNLDAVDLELYRITDRTLYRHIALGHIGGEIPADEYADLRAHFAEHFWSGTVRLSEASAKRNEMMRLSLPVRSILEERREWLKRELAANKGETAEIVSLSLPVSGMTDAGVSAQGRFYAGAAPFEQSALDLLTPGVYALLTREQAPASDDKADRNDCAAGRQTGGSKEDCRKFLVQWFLNTDIGLTFYEGDRDFVVIARSLRSGAAMDKTKIELVSAGNRVLATAPTNEFGVATFARSLTRGTQSNALVAILAQRQDDFAFITFGPERLDLSRLNLDGRPITHGVSAFLTTDRGIYQPGETVNLLALIRDPNGVAPDAPPKMTLRLEARDRTPAVQRIEPQIWKLGGAAFPIALPRTLRPGSARITLTLGEADDAPVIGETIVQIGPVRPDRARINFVDLKTWRAHKTAGGFVELAGALNAQYLFASEGSRSGAAHDLKAETLVKVAPADSPTRGCYEKFTFGRFDEAALPVSSRQFLDYTDAQGDLKLDLSGIAVPETSRPMAATVAATVFDAAGPLASRSMTFPIADDNGWIGLAKIPRLRPGANSGTFDLDVDLVSVAPGGRAPAALEFLLQRERDLYVWEHHEGSWQHVRSIRPETVTQGTVEPDRPTRIPAMTRAADGSPCADTLQVKNLARGLDVGRYVLTVSDGTRKTSVRFYAGTASTDPDQLEPNIFTLSTDKESYRPNEPIKLTAEVSFDGEVLVAFADGDVRRWATGEARNGTATITMPAPPEWVGKGMYALATAFRANADGSQRRGPGRAIGATHFEVVGEQAGYAAAVHLIGRDGQRLGSEIGPDDPLSFEVCVADASGCSAHPPAEAYAAAYVVDEGLLSLTGRLEQMPDPERFFYGRARFGLRVMDNYDRLLLKEGGDRPTRLALSNYTSTKIVSLAAAPIKLENGKGTFTIPKLDLPNGSVSIFVVVWSKDYAAAANVKVAIHSAVVADMHVPPFLLAGDRAMFPLRLENIDFVHEGDFALRVAAAGPIKGVALFAAGQSQPALAKEAELRIPLRQTGSTTTVYLAVDTPPNGQGKSTLAATIEPIGTTAPLAGNKREWSFELRRPVLSSVDTAGFPLGRESTNLNRLVESLMAGAYDPDSVTVTARFSDGPQPLLGTEVASLQPDNAAPPILDYLVWQGLQLLYAGDASGADAKHAQLTRVLGEVESLQLPNGSFVPYRTAGDFARSEVTLVKAGPNDTSEPKDGVLRAATALDLLELAARAGYDVPARALRTARRFLADELKQGPSADCSFASAYALLVLVSSGSSDVDKEQIDALMSCRDDVAVEAAAAVVATKYGLSDQAKAAIDDLKDQSNIAEQLRKLSDYRLAMVLAFLSDARAPAPLINAVADVLLAPGKGSSLSRAALAWVMRASAKTGAVASKLTAQDIVITGAAAGQLHRGRNGVLETAAIPYRRLSAAPVSVATRTDRGARGVLSIEGVLTKPAEASRAPQGALKRRFFDAESGRELDPARDGFKIGDRIVVVLEGTRAALPVVLSPDNQPVLEGAGPLLVADLLPSAFEIVAGNVFDQPGFALQGALAKLKPRGDLRSVEVAPDRWIGLVTPVSWLEGTPHQPDGGGDQTPTGRARAPTGEEAVEFRQAYLVRVNMAGHFTLPALSVEPTVPPIKTLRADQTAIDVKTADRN